MENKGGRMYSRRLFIAGPVLLLLLFVYGCGGSSSGLSAPGPLIVNSTLSALKISAYIPPMEVKHQVLVAVSIFPTGGHIPVSDVQVVKDATAIVANPTPVGTPGRTLVDAFGSNHSVIATATLVTSTDIFSVAPAGPQSKPLDQERVEWNWFVTPLVDGRQTIGVDIEVQWTSTTSGKQSLPYTLGFPKFPARVEALPVVPTPTPKPDPIGIITAIWSPMATIIAAVISTMGLLLVALLARPEFRQWMTRLRRSKKKSPTELEIKRTSDRRNRKNKRILRR
jgi:hypothetical protein